MYVFIKTSIRSIMRFEMHETLIHDLNLTRRTELMFLGRGFRPAHDGRFWTRFKATFHLAGRAIHIVVPHAA